MKCILILVAVLNLLTGCDTFGQLSRSDPSFIMTSKFKCIESTLKKIPGIKFEKYEISESTVYSANSKGEKYTHTYSYIFELDTKYPQIFKLYPNYPAEITIRPSGSENGGFLNRFRGIAPRVKHERLKVLKTELLRVEKHVSKGCNLKIRSELIQKLRN